VFQIIPTMKASEVLRTYKHIRMEEETLEEELSKQDVLQLLAELEQRINESGISSDMKEKATTYLSAAKEAIDKEEPNKERAKINLKGVAEELEKASKVAETGTTLFIQVMSILVKVTGWLGGVAVDWLGGVVVDLFLSTL